MQYILSPHIITLLLLTGCRLNEIASLKWDYIDFDCHCIRLPSSKTGQRLVGLGVPALEYLKALPRFKEGFLFPSQVADKYYTSTPKCWRDMHKNLDLEDVRLHDLRHTFGSVGGELGCSFARIGALLGHAGSGTTSRYVHFGNDVLGQAATKISELILLRLQGNNNVIPISSFQYKA